MRTNIEIDDKLMRTAMRLGGFKTKRAAVHAALERFVQLQNQKTALDHLWGAHHLIDNYQEIRKANAARSGW